MKRSLLQRSNLAKKASGLLLTGLMTCLLLAGCGETPDKSTPAETEIAPVAATVTVTFKNQDTTLGTATANAGEVLDASSYSAFETLEGTEFGGWFETPTLLAASKKDLTKDTFNEDTTLYGDFKNLNVTEDTRRWYIAGSSTKGSLKLNNWASSLSDEEKAL
ncbi:MAG: hypothetical protein IJ589_05715, partial [Lachnospiraceae bacterium]|nr:hypothetical protein [Lachnospiraceae bacterium]